MFSFHYPVGRKIVRNIENASLYVYKNYDIEATKGCKIIKVIFLGFTYQGLLPCSGVSRKYAYFRRYAKNRFFVTVRRRIEIFKKFQLDLVENT